MNWVFSAIVALLVLTTGWFAQAAPASFKFGGEDFVQKFEVKGRAPNAQIEFGLATEPLKDWTRLVTLHSFVQNGNDAKRAAATLANLVRERYKGAKYRVISNARTGEATIDFLIPVPNSELMEFNVFKYAPAGSELVAFQFAQRVKLGEIDADELRAVRERAIGEMTDYDMASVKVFFGKQ
jgi:hypothetical protein